MQCFVKGKKKNRVPSTSSIKYYGFFFSTFVVLFSIQVPLYHHVVLLLATYFFFAFFC